MKCLWEPSRTMRRAYADEDTCDSVCGNMAVWPNLKKPHVTCMTLVPVKEELCLRRMCTQGSYGLMGSGAPTMKGNTRTCDQGRKSPTSWPPPISTSSSSCCFSSSFSFPSPLQWRLMASTSYYLCSTTALGGSSWYCFGMHGPDPGSSANNI